MRNLRRWLVFPGLCALLAGCPDTDEVDNSSPSPTVAPSPTAPPEETPTQTPVPVDTPTPTPIPDDCQLKASPDNLNFGPVLEGRSSALEVSLQAEAGTCVVNSLEVDADGDHPFLAEPAQALPVTLTGAETLTVTVTFQPPDPGPWLGVLVASAGLAKAEVSLEGQGLPDRDGDGYPDDLDGCPDDPDPEQEDADLDGVGDACDACPADPDNDIDQDGICGNLDNCPDQANLEQEDGDLDGDGDVCDACPQDAANDVDADGVCGDVDNCPEEANSGQEDQDQDSLGDVCDPCPSGPGKDTDGDGWCDVADNCQVLANPDQADADGDEKGDACDACPEDPADDADRDGLCANVDNCPALANPTQADADKDGVGDACDACKADPANDVDGDGVCGNVDNCPAAGNPGQEDGDGDGLGDACDACPADPANDVDADGVCGDVDNCPLEANPGQNDTDGDLLGDACDVCPSDALNDGDQDGVCGDVDNCPLEANSGQENADGDALGDACDACPQDPDNDQDGDGVCGDVDNCPMLANLDQENQDGDLEGDVCDVCPLDEANDEDGDGLCAEVDNCPQDSNPWQENADLDTLGDACDACIQDPLNDEDLDGVCGDVDNCPSDANLEQGDQDGDNQGDVCDLCPADRDNDLDQDGVCGDVDNCPVIPNPDQGNSDGDGVGDACDVEECDNLDNDGDLAVDEDFTDADGLGGADCHDLDADGLTEEAGDCNDEVASTFPGAEDSWYDGVDSDCNGDPNPPYCQELPPVFTVTPTADCGMDLEARVLGLCGEDCQNNVRVVVEVINHGSSSTPAGVPVRIFGVTSEGQYALLGTEVLDAIPGGSSSGGLSYELGPFDDLYIFPSIMVSVDDNGSSGTLAECDESNNFDTGLTSSSSCPVPDVCEVSPPGYPVPQNSTCSYTPPSGVFTPRVEWQKGSFTGQSAYNQVMMTPVVGNLTDDNGDGKINDKDTPDIVFTAFTSTNYGGWGVLRAISGDTGAELWSTNPVVCASAGVALADANRDGYPEVYTVDCYGQPMAFSRTGAQLWTCPQAANATTYDIYSYPSVADVEGDGDAEILVGSTVCDHRGFKVVTTSMRHSWISFFQDWDQDGTMEIVSGSGVSRIDGTTVWTGPGGHAAVANFDADAQPELVSVNGGYMYLTDYDGKSIWAKTIPGGGGGAPTVADFDGDGDPEVGVAGAYYYSVFEKSGTVRWSQPVTDASSSVTGSSVYDFEGDGKAEVVYGDEYTLWVYDGATGKVLLKEDGHANWTLWEYPVIADVDKDGHAEIVLASNNVRYAGWTGITVLGDTWNNWVTARPVWNQHAYHITNINDDLTVPTHQEPNWLTGNNTFRQGGFGKVGIFAAPDLVPSLVSTCPQQCPATGRYLFQVQNGGVNDVSAGLPYAVYGETSLGQRVKLLTGAVPDAIPAGWTTDALEVLISSSVTASYPKVVLVVDDDGNGGDTQNECKEDNNSLELPAACSSIVPE